MTIKEDDDNKTMTNQTMTMNINYNRKKEEVIMLVRDNSSYVGVKEQIKPTATGNLLVVVVPIGRQR